MHTLIQRQRRPPSLARNPGTHHKPGCGWAPGQRGGGPKLCLEPSSGGSLQAGLVGARRGWAEGMLVAAAAEELWRWAGVLGTARFSNKETILILLCLIGFDTPSLSRAARAVRPQDADYSVLVTFQGVHAWALEGPGSGWPPQPLPQRSPPPTPLPQRSPPPHSHRPPARTPTCASAGRS